MYSYLKCICFSWIFNCIWVAADNVTLEDILPCPANLFGVTSFSHSSLLISWEPKQLNKGKSKEVKFSSFPLEGNIRSNRTDNCNFYHGQCKISSLKENTTYKIVIDYQSNCSIVGKTVCKKSNSRPTKPDFKFKINEYKYVSFQIRILQPIVEIEWLPCGRKGYCEGDEFAGSHFSIKYKMLYSRQEWRTYEYDRMNKILRGLSPGKPYEVVVTSINGENVDLETESDPQEIFIPPVSSPVRSVNVMTLTNSSVLILWKPPKIFSLDSEDTTYDYGIFYSVCNNSPTVLLNYSGVESPYNVAYYYQVDDSNSGFRQIKIIDLIPGTCYTFFIIPAIVLDFEFNDPQIVYGFDHRVDYTPQTYQVNMTLAQPGFQAELLTENCQLMVKWLPCGEIYDCEDTKPGSYFLIKYRNMTDGSDWENMETIHDFTVTKLYEKHKYKFLVESRDEYNKSKSSKEQMIDTSECGGRSSEDE